jgi:hypothetical protein
LTGHCGHWESVVVENQDCRFEGLLSENASVGTRPRAVSRVSQYQTFATSLDHLVGAQQNRVWNLAADRFGGFHIDRQLS